VREGCVGSCCCVCPSLVKAPRWAAPLAWAWQCRRQCQSAPTHGMGLMTAQCVLDITAPPFSCITLRMTSFAAEGSLSSNSADRGPP